jgi:translation initiation factor 1
MKNKLYSYGFVYSSNPDFKFEEEQNNEQDTLIPSQQKLRVWLDSKQRAGKIVTLITGFAGTENDLIELGKKLKNYCGTGGSAKNGEILVQGDQREKILQYLLKNGYTQTKKAG